MITGKSFESLVPPPFIEEKNILDLIKAYR